MSCYYTFTPSPPLLPFVKKFWLYRADLPGASLEKVLPHGAFQVVFNLREDVIRLYSPQNPRNFQELKGSVVVGAYSKFFIIDQVCQKEIMGVEFRPGGAFPFLSANLGELYNTHLSLDLLWGERATELREKLMKAVSPELKFSILEVALNAAIVKPLLVHKVVKFALNEFQSSNGSVARVTGKLGVSQRYFIQLFREEVGLTPKLFLRVRRFQRALGQINGGEKLELVHIAQECGYFDQSHFTRDFQAFSGLNPSTYTDHEKEHQNHLVIW